MKDSTCNFVKMMSQHSIKNFAPQISVNLMAQDNFVVVLIQR